MKYTILSLEPKELNVLTDILKYEIELRSHDLSNATTHHPEDLLWMAEHAHKAATLLHKIHLAVPSKKKGKK